MSNQHHPDAAAIDRLGVEPIMSHFEISRQAISYWRRKGVPKQHRKTLAMLGAVAGVDMPELRQGRASPPSPPAQSAHTQKEA